GHPVGREISPTGCAALQVVLEIELRCCIKRSVEVVADAVDELFTGDPHSVTGGASPDLLQPMAASAFEAIEPVAHRILLVIILVILLGRIERGCGENV